MKIAAYKHIWPLPKVETRKVRCVLRSAATNEHPKAPEIPSTSGAEKEPTRPIPTGDVLAWREGYLHALRYIAPAKPQLSYPEGLSPGNTKTGQSGSLYRSVFVWNLPSVATCPGLSKWCMHHCYNADRREAIFMVHSWAENWWWSTKRPKVLRSRISSQLESATAPIAVRLHSSCDFFSVAYIKLWQSIARRHPSVLFW